MADSAGGWEGVGAGFAKRILCLDSVVVRVYLLRELSVQVNRGSK